MQNSEFKAFSLQVPYKKMKTTNKSPSLSPKYGFEMDFFNSQVSNCKTFKG